MVHKPYLQVQMIDRCETTALLASITLSAIEISPILIGDPRNTFNWPLETFDIPLRKVMNASR